MSEIDPETSQGEELLPHDWSEDQEIYLTTAYEMGWTLERALGAAKAVAKKDLIDCDKRACSELLQYLYAMRAEAEVARAEWERELREDR